MRRPSPASFSNHKHQRSSTRGENVWPDRPSRFRGACGTEIERTPAKFPAILARAKRYAEMEERLISPEGTFPVIGRSSAYRSGAFQTLSLVALRHELSASVNPAAVRCALDTVIHRMIEAPGTFDENGWLRVGGAGYQPAVRERYISTGSLSLYLTGLLHLGLPAGDPLWTAPAQPWTRKRLWTVEDVPANHSK